VRASSHFSTSGSMKTALGPASVQVLRTSYRSISSGSIQAPLNEAWGSVGSRAWVNYAPSTDSSELPLPSIRVALMTSSVPGPSAYLKETSTPCGARTTAL
jgi:hypothetical protein